MRKDTWVYFIIKNAPHSELNKIGEKDSFVYLSSPFPKIQMSTLDFSHVNWIWWRMGNEYNILYKPQVKSCKKKYIRFLEVAFIFPLLRWAAYVSTICLFFRFRFTTTRYVLTFINAKKWWRCASEKRKKRLFYFEKVDLSWRERQLSRVDRWSWWVKRVDLDPFKCFHAYDSTGSGDWWW